MARAGLTAERLVQAGAEMADEIGFAHITGAALAKHFNVKQASLYSHIESFDDLKSRIARLALSEIARSAEALAGRTGKAALAALISRLCT
ncbi:hypothetical protein PY650_13975 [Rhizobium calliandrae]|uniref:HTH tetR-type domain-containing protein n=1 Tax=Rhizobium calliandrae TaxID=1312182 RepID=A0ABT7KDQ3_9HYPH|nr:hypothetical protein [Rhizobium calliandrae]MDL2406750.1 hypothetical protein [Rhizobium calliandrae]